MGFTYIWRCWREFTIDRNSVSAHGRPFPRGYRRATDNRMIICKNLMLFWLERDTRLFVAYSHVTVHVGIQLSAFKVRHDICIYLIICFQNVYIFLYILIYIHSVIEIKFRVHFAQLLLGIMKYKFTSNWKKFVLPSSKSNLLSFSSGESVVVLTSNFSVVVLFGSFAIMLAVYIKTRSVSLRNISNSIENK